MRFDNNSISTCLEDNIQFQSNSITYSGDNIRFQDDSTRTTCSGKGIAFQEDSIICSGASIGF